MMSVLKWLGSSCFLMRKNVVSFTSIRGCSVDASEASHESSQCAQPETKKSQLDIILEERDKIDLDTKIRYMRSKAYRQTYGDLPVWTVYVRNFKGHFPPKPRANCILMGRFTSRNPCPICRDKYLIADYRNVDLLKQFISPYGGEIISNRKTGVCQHQHSNILIAIHKARNFGLLSYPVPFRRYDYSLYQK